MVVDKYYDELPDQIPYLIDPKAGPKYHDLEEHGHSFDDWGVVRTNDICVTWSRADPGSVLDWHSHAPDFYQIHVVLKGRIRWYYKDNEGEKQHVEAGPGEVLYLPGGSENKIEVVGDEEHEKILINPRVRMSRLEYFIKEGGYRRQTDFGHEGALVYDNDNDREVDVTEDAIVNLEEVREMQRRREKQDEESD